LLATLLLLFLLPAVVVLSIVEDDFLWMDGEMLAASDDPSSS
jgi:hypothetical protein